MNYKGYTTVELTKPERSYFNMSHELRVSTRFGKLTPVFFAECLPNDTFQVSTQVLLRLAPLLRPIFHNVQVYVHFFFVNNRILWKDWEKFITGGRLGPGITSAPVPPNVDIALSIDEQGDIFDVGSLYDYLGGNPIASGAGWTDRKIDLMPFAAYYKVWYDYYRDRNYIDDNEILPLDSGTSAIGDVLDIMQIQTRSWNADRFTTAMTSTQRGAEVLMPLEGSGVVTYRTQTSVSRTSDGNPLASNTLGTNVSGGLQGVTGAVAARVENIDEVILDSSDVSINDLRVAVALQKWLERNQLAGSRMNELILSQYARRTSDGRLQRAEYLGGGKITVNINEVVTTAYSVDAADEVVPPANQTGHSLTYGDTNGFKYNTEEWGFVIGIMSIMPRTGYMQGAAQHFFGRNTYLDYPWPLLAHLGEEPVYKYELYANAANLPADRTAQPIFGYQSRYSYWKDIASGSRGEFRTTLKDWHLDREFASSPVLGNDFVVYPDANQDRIFAVSGVDTCWCYIYNRCGVQRSLPYFGTPRL